MYRIHNGNCVEINAISGRARARKRGWKLEFLMYLENNVKRIIDKQRLRERERNGIIENVKVEE